jgi:hypothetical protein
MCSLKEVMTGKGKKFAGFLISWGRNQFSALSPLARFSNPQCRLALLFN